MASRDPESRSLIASLATAERWGRCDDRVAATAPARAGLRAKYAREVDPNGTLSDVELERRVDSLMKAHMLRMTLAAKASRRKAREASESAARAEAELEKFGGAA